MFGQINHNVVDFTGGIYNTVHWNYKWIYKTWIIPSDEVGNREDSAGRETEWELCRACLLAHGLSILG